MKRRLWLAGGLAAAAAAGAGVSLYRSRKTQNSVLWGMSFTQPDGNTLTMASLRGKPLLLNFWAPWCPPCVREMPMLDRFHRDRAARGWEVVGLAVDAAPPVRAFLAKVPIDFPIGLAGLDGAELSRKLGNDNGGLPFSVVFDADGQIADTKLGAVTPEELEAWDHRLGKSA